MTGFSRFGLYVGKVFGIRFYLHYSWFLIFAVVTYELAAEVFPANIPRQPSSVYLIMAVVSALTFFLSILLHELGHSLVSQRCGIPVPRITLMFIGGIAEISREPDTARAELKIAAGGPAVSIVLALLYSGGAYIAYLCSWDAASLVLQWLAFVNVSLVLFNLIPGYPLDGGRILRAIIWGRTRDLRKATYITTRIGVGFSWVLIGLGLLLMARGNWNAFVFLIIGIFLKTAAESGYTSALYHEVLAGVRVADIMTRNPVCIPGHTPVNLAVDEFFLAKNHVAYPVVDQDQRFLGMLRLEYLKALPRDKWPWTSAADVASSEEAAGASIDGSQPAEQAMRRLLAAARAA